MKPEQVWQDFIDLPTKAQQQVCELIAALKQQYQTTSVVKPHTAPKLSEEPFIGIWQDRAELSDSSQWVRQVRAQQWREEWAQRGDG